MVDVYESVFFDYIERGAARSASFVVPIVRRLLQPNSVLDVGCGRGVWLKQWQTTGVDDFAGVDGAYVSPDTLAIGRDRFSAHDLAQSFSLGRRFDLVQSLEVAEHVDGRCADTFVANLVQHGDVILFSAAIPGQGGSFHVNEQRYEYWRDKFARAGFRQFDWLRPRVASIADVEPWYRYNTFLYVRDDVVRTMPDELVRTEIPRGARVPDVAPLAWRLRARLIGLLPRRAVHALADVKHRVEIIRHRR